MGGGLDGVKRSGRGAITARGRSASRVTVCGDETTAASPGARCGFTPHEKQLVLWKYFYFGLPIELYMTSSTRFFGGCTCSRERL